MVSTSIPLKNDVTNDTVIFLTDIFRLRCWNPGSIPPVISFTKPGRKNKFSRSLLGLQKFLSAVVPVCYEAAKGRKTFSSSF